MTKVHDKERSLTREVSRKVEAAVPGTEVLAVELGGPERFTVFLDHPDGVDHALCARVTSVLRDYLREYSVDVSSPGLERPLRKPAHFERVVGRKIALKTEHEIEGRKKFRGELLAADAKHIRLGADGGEAVRIPYEEIVRGNLIYEG